MATSSSTTKSRLPEDLLLIEVEPTNVIMEGIYRIDELARYRTLVPSDRSILELNAGWTSSLKLGKEYRQVLYFVEKRMSVAEICYHMHASAFHVYGQLYTLISEGVARVTGELPEETPVPVTEVEDLPESVTEMVWSAERKLEQDPEAALLIIQKALQQQPNNPEAQSLLPVAEEKYVKRVYETGGLSPRSVPQLLVSPAELTNQQIDPQEGFVLSRINGTWDIQSILSICPFREADCLRMIKKLMERGIIASRVEYPSFLKPRRFRHVRKKQSRDPALVRRSLESGNAEAIDELLAEDGVVHGLDDASGKPVEGIQGFP